MEKNSGKIHLIPWRGDFEPYYLQHMRADVSMPVKAEIQRR
jgi:hypothetical protein